MVSMKRSPEQSAVPAPLADPGSVTASGAVRPAEADPAAGQPVQGRWARRVALTLIGVSVALAAWSFAIPFLFGLGVRELPWWRQFFDLNHETNLTAWWSSGLLLLGAIGFAVVGLVRRSLRADRRLALLAWLTPSALLAAMSLDEFTQIHERLGEVWDALPFTPENPLHAFQGLILGVPIALAVIALLALTAMMLPRRTRALAVTGIVVFFVGAIGLEAVPLVFNIARASWVYHAVTHLEELTEMIGSSLLIVAPWAHLHLRRAPGSLLVTTDGLPAAAEHDDAAPAGR